MTITEGSCDGPFLLSDQSVSDSSTKNKESVEYPDLPSAMRPVPHDLPVPKPPETWNIHEADEDATLHKPDVENDIDPGVELLMPGYPHLIAQPAVWHQCFVSPNLASYI